MTNGYSIKYKDREIESPVGRFLIVILMGFGMFVMVLGLMLIIVLIPVMIVLHPIFMLFGRKGTMRGDTLALDREAFRKR